MMPERPTPVVRRYAHLLLPQASLGEPQRRLFDASLQPAGWVADPSVPSGMSLQWSRKGDLLRLQTLGWFPLLMTVGPVGKATRGHRDAVARLVSSVRADGGRTLTDRQLVDYLPQAEGRWQRALTERRRIARAERFIEARKCSLCAAWVDHGATHCVACRHRFTADEDSEREDTIGNAKSTITSAEKILSDLARGVLLDGLDPSGDSRPRTVAEEATSVVMRRG